MLRATDVVGLAAAACAAAALLVSLPGVAWLRRKAPLATLLVALALPLLPIGGLPAAGYLRGVLGDLSVTTTVLLLVYLLRPVLPLPTASERSRLALQGLVATGGLVLYPLALGFGPADPYRLGFAHVGFLCTLLLLTVASWYAGLQFVATCLALAVLAWAIGALESRNLWDHLLDPLCATWAVGALGRRLVGRQLDRRQLERASSDTL